MPDQTSPLGLPYPLDTDQIDVAGDIEKLARAINNSAANAEGWMSQRWVKTTGDRMSGDLILTDGAASNPPIVEGAVLNNAGILSLARERETGSMVILYRGINVNGQVGDQYIRFMNREAGGTEQITAGTITLQAGPSVAYNTSSDHRLKDVLGSVPDAVERLKALKPVQFAWKETGDVEDGFIAHEVQEVAPYAVVGEKDAVAGPPEETDDTPEGTVIPQQLSAMKLLPIVVAALQDALARIEELEAR